MEPDALFAQMDTNQNDSVSFSEFKKVQPERNMWLLENLARAHARLRDPDSSVRVAAVGVMGELAPNVLADHERPLVVALKDEISEVRDAASNELKRLGRDGCIYPRKASNPALFRPRSER